MKYSVKAEVCFPMHTTVEAESKDEATKLAMEILKSNVDTYIRPENYTLTIYRTAVDND